MFCTNFSINLLYSTQFFLRSFSRAKPWCVLLSAPKTTAQRHTRLSQAAHTFQSPSTLDDKVCLKTEGQGPLQHTRIRDFLTLLDVVCQKSRHKSFPQEHKWQTKTRNIRLFQSWYANFLRQATVASAHAAQEIQEGKLQLWCGFRWPKRLPHRKTQRQR